MGFPSVLPNTPEAKSLGKYSGIPIGLFTGAPNISIPLYEIKIDEFKLPISINYSSNGIKVDQISSNVGLGWALFSGGIITRSLNDDMDEDFRVSLPNYPYDSAEMQTFLEGINTNPDGNDTEPDIFSYNFNGHNGKFYLDENFQPKLIEPSDIIIEKLDGYNNDYFVFKATTSDGTIYWFGGEKAIESSHLMTTSGGDHTDPTDIVQNAWYLSKITFPNINDSIIFSYANGYANHISSITQNVKAERIIDERLSGGLPSYIAAYHTTPIITYIYPLMSRITSINWKSGHIDFIYSSRFDVGNFVKLDTINIYNNSQDLIKSYFFDYLKVDCESTFGNPDIENFNDQTVYKRLFLISLQDVTTNVNPINPYVFKYSSPEELPPRFSYAQDYWGFFNGKDNPDLVPDDLSLFEENWYNSINCNYNEISPLFQNVGGDKSPDGMYGKMGLLTKIEYPTGGSDSLIYESHTINEIEHQLPNSTPIDIYVETDSIPWQNEEVYITDTIPFDQTFIPFYVSIDIKPCWDTTNPPQWIRMNVYIDDMTTDTLAPIYTYNPMTGIYNAVTPPYLTVTQNGLNQYFISFIEGHQYKFHLELFKPCLYGQLHTSYYNEYGEDVSVNKEVGGMRIKKIIRNDSFETENIRCFYYGYWDSLYRSSGILVPVMPAISYYAEASFYTSNEVNYRRTETTINLSSSSLFPISNYNGNHIYYETVVEGLGENFENGAIVHKYNIENDSFPNIYWDPVLGTPNTNLSFENGKEIEKTYYRKIGDSFLLSNKILNSYINDKSLQNTFQGFSTSPAYYYTSISFMKSNLCTYNINSQWHYLNKTDSFVYDENGLNPILTTTNYYYDNANHLQLTKKQTTDSKGNIIKDYYYYPGDYDNIENFAKLIEQNIISKPVKTFSTNNNNIIDGRIYKYNDNGSVIEVNKYENSDLLTKPVHNPTVVTSIPDFFDKKADITYHPITKKPIEYLPVDDYPITYIWGYNNTYVVAKIENSTFNVVESNLGCTYEELQGKTESELKVIFENLRVAMPDAMITSYTYVPLVGMSTKTDENGKTTYYQYDDLNRLVTIRDNDYNVVKHINYHYSSNN